jgi:hypothetical protein
MASAPPAAPGLLEGDASRRWLVATGTLVFAVILVCTARIADFMSGRFFSTPFVVGLCLLGRTPMALRRPALAATAAVLVGLGLAAPVPTVLSDATFTGRAILALHTGQTSGWSP